MKYYSRAFSVFWVFGWIVWATSKIGEPSTGQPISWLSAWGFGLMIAASVACGWLAKKEHYDHG